MLIFNMNIAFINFIADQFPHAGDGRIGGISPMCAYIFPLIILAFKTITES